MNLQTKYETLGAIGSVRELNFEEILSFSPKTLLYFYPRDNTPGCTKEARDFSCLKNQIKMKY